MLAIDNFEPVIILFVFLTLTGSFMVTLAIIGLHNFRVRGALPYSGLCFSIAIYTIFYALEIISPSLSYALLFNKIQYIGISLMPVWALIFCLQFAGYWPGRSLIKLSLPWIIPLLIIALRFTDEFHGLVYNQVSAIIDNGLLILKITPGPAYWLNILYLNTIFLACFIILIRTFINTARKIVKKQILMIIAGMLAPWIAHILYQTGNGPHNTDLTPYGFAITMLFLGYAIFFFDLFDVNPIVREHVFSGMADSVIVTDLHHSIVDANRSAMQLFGGSTLPLIGIDLNNFLKKDSGDKSIIDSNNENEKLIISVKSKAHTFLVRRSLIKDSSMTPFGYIFVFHDITEDIIAEEALRAKTIELENYFSNSLDLLCVLDREGEILHVNPTWVEITGYKPGEILGTTILDLVHTEDRKEVLRKFLEIRTTNEKINCVARFRNSSGNYIWLEWRVNATNDLLYASIRDITTRVEEQEALNTLIKYSEDFLALPPGTMDYELIFDNFLSLSNARYMTMYIYTDEQFNRKASIYRIEKQGNRIEVHLVPEDKKETIESLFSSSTQDPADKIGLITKLNTDYLKTEILDDAMIDVLTEGELFVLKIPIGNRIAGDIIFVSDSNKADGWEKISELFARQTGIMLARKEVEQETRYEKAYFETLFDSSPAGIVLLDSSDRILKCNNEFLQMFGYLEHEVLNNLINDLIVPDHLKEEGISLTDSVARGMIIRQKSVRKRKGGELLHVSILGKPMQMLSGEHLVYGIYIDISDQVAAENLLKQRQAELQNSLDLQKIISEIALELNAPLVFESRINTVIETIGKAISVSRVYIFENNNSNEFSSNTFEWCNENIKSKKERLETVSLSKLEWFRQKLTGDGNLISGDTSLLDRTTRELLDLRDVKAMVVYPLYVKNSFFGFIGYAECINIRDWTNPELELLRAVSAIISNSYERRIIELTLLSERDKANLANIAKSEFLANMSHEIRTPMNAILGFSESLYEKLTEPEYKNMLNSVLSSGRTLLSLLNDILDLSKIESGKIEISRYSINLSSLIEEVITLFQDKAKRKDINLYFEKPDIFPVEISLDEIRVKQVLFNMIGNAVKFTHNGYVSVLLKFQPEAHNRGELQIIIKDTGIGIPAGQLESIFDTFIQVSGRSASRQYEGTGLGLSISKRLVEKMNGEIRLKSKEGVGSEFTIVLKDVQYSNILTEKVQVNVIDPEVIMFKNSSAVVIDDVESNLILMQSILENFGIRTHTVTDSNEAIKVINNVLPEIIVVDLMMPGISGFDIAENVRFNPETKNIPVIAYTAALIELNASDQAHLFNGVFVKPVNRIDIVKELCKYLEYTSQTSCKVDVPQKIEEPDIFNLMTKEKISELLLLLKTVFTPQWELIKDQLVLKKIGAFANGLKEMAISFNFAYLELYSDSLLSGIKNLDLDQIQEKLKNFPEIIEKIEKQMKHNTKDE